MKIFTKMHLLTASHMPFKPRWAKDRKVIARFYRMLRSGKYHERGRQLAMTYHRMGVVVSADESQKRIQVMLANGPIDGV